MKTESRRFVIIGAGPTGLGAARRLAELGCGDFAILEQQDEVGGLAGSRVDEKGFTWDIGGHVLFSHYPYFDKLLSEAYAEHEWNLRNRSAWAWMRGTFVPYPVQNNIRHFPKEEVLACIEGLLERNADKTAAFKGGNFEDWILASYGRGLADSFLLPYNFKVWAFPPATMSYQWIGERVAPVDLKKVIGNVILGKDEVSWGPNNRFLFPKRGGTGGIWQKVASRIGADKILLGRRVVSVDCSKKLIRTSDGESIHYEFLLSTLPLDLFCAMLEGPLRARLAPVAAQLKHSSSHIVGVGLSGPLPERLNDKSWIYFPENDCPYYRVSVFSNHSSENVPMPGKQWSLLTETSESAAKPVNRASLVAETVAALHRNGLINGESQVVSTWYYVADYGYPTPSLRRDAILAQVMPELEAVDVFSRGRFGAWKYEVSNQDHSVMQGVEWAERMLLSQAETVATFPSVPAGP